MENGSGHAVRYVRESSTIAYALIAAAFVAGICAGCSGIYRLEPTAPTAPNNDIEILIARAIRRTVIEEKDIPDYQLLADKRRIVVSNRAYTGRPFTLPYRPSDWANSDSLTLTAGALPSSDEVQFFLLSPSEIQLLADRRDDDFLYLEVSDVTLQGHTAFVQLSTTWAKPRTSNVVYLSGGGYRLEYRKIDGDWVFQRITNSWIS